MVRHDMQAANQKVRSEQIRLSLGLLTPAEREAKAKAEVEKKEKEAKQAAMGTPLFGRPEVSADSTERTPETSEDAP